MALFCRTGYFLNVFPTFNCHVTGWCAVQFALHQIGNSGILVSEAAMSLEMLEFTNFVRTRQVISNFKVTPNSVKTMYMYYLIFTIGTVGFGFATFNESVTCWFEVWCWYKQPWEFFLFKFAWIGVVIAFAIVVILFMEVELFRARLRGEAPKATHKAMIRVLRNCLCVHIFAWGSALLWRIGLTAHSDFSHSNILEFIVVINAAGAGYLDIIVFLTFPAVRRRLIDPVVLRVRELLGLPPPPTPLMHVSSDSSLYKPPELTSSATGSGNDCVSTAEGKYDFIESFEGSSRSSSHSDGDFY